MDDNTFGVPPMAVAVPVLACIAIVLDVAPLLWHIKHHNFAATSLVLWVVLSNIFGTINALIWPTGDVSNWWPGYVLCDIEAKLILGTSVGIPGGLACIMRNLALVLDTEGSYLVPSRAQRRKQLAFDFFFCIGMPIYIMAIHYVVQPSRYYIFQIAGCLTSFDDSWPTVILVWIWPSVLCLICLYYSGKYGYDGIEGPMLISISASNATHAQVPPRFFVNTQHVKLEPYKVSIQAPVLHDNDPYRGRPSCPILCLLPKCVLSTYSIRLERYTWAKLGGHNLGSDRRSSTL